MKYNSINVPRAYVFKKAPKIPYLNRKLFYPQYGKLKVISVYLLFEQPR